MKKKEKKRRKVQGIMKYKKQAIHEALDFCSTVTQNTQL
jgi:hypothetical protein